MKRLLGLLLAAAIVFAGCGTDAPGPDVDLAPDSEITLQVVESNGEQAVFTGRYIEVEITPPHPDGDISSLWLTDAGLVCGYYDAYYITTDGGTTWTEMDTSWTQELEYDSYSIQHVEGNGTVWLLTNTYVAAGADGDPHYQGTIWRILPNGDPTRIDINEDVHSVLKVLPLDEGKVLVQYNTLAPESYELEQNVGVFDTNSGGLLYKIEFYPYYTEGNVFVSDGFIYFFEIFGSGTDGFSAKKFDPGDGTELAIYPDILPRDGYYYRNRTNGHIVVSNDNLYYVNEQGINRVALGGSLSEVILEYGRYSFQGNGMWAWDFLIDNQNTLYVVSSSIEYNPAAPDRLYRYTYDPDAPYYEDDLDQGTIYYAERNREDGQNSICAGLPDGETAVVVENINQIQAENETYLVFTRNRIDGEVQTQPATLTLHYYDKAMGEVRDIFTDTWEEWGDDYRATAGVVLGAISGDKDWNQSHPGYTLVAGKLQFYISYIEENKTEQYLFDFETGSMDLQDTIYWGA